MRLLNKDCLDKKLDALKAKLDEFKEPNSLVFALFSDLHASGVETDRANKFLEALEAVCKRVNPDAVVNLGDNLAMLGRTEHITNERLLSVFCDLFDKIKSATKKPLFILNGNHDGIGTDFFKPEFFNSAVKGKYDDGLAKYDGEGSYYYVDFAKARLRAVFLSVPCDSDKLTTNQTPVCSFGKKQLAWLRSVALNTDYEIVLFCHLPFFYEFRGDNTTTVEVWNGSTTATSFRSALCGGIDDVSEAIDILNQKTPVACFSGHIHASTLFAPHEVKGADKNPLSCAQFTIKQAVAPNPKEDELGVAIDLIVWNPTEKRLGVIKLDCEQGEITTLSPLND